MKIVIYIRFNAHRDIVAQYSYGVRVNFLRNVKTTRVQKREVRYAETNSIFSSLSHITVTMCQRNNHDDTSPFDFIHSFSRFRVCEFASVSPAFAGIDLVLPRIPQLPSVPPMQLSAPSLYYLRIR